MLVSRCTYLDAGSQRRASTRSTRFQEHVCSLWSTGSEPDAADGYRGYPTDGVELDSIVGVRGSGWSKRGGVYYHIQSEGVRLYSHSLTFSMQHRSFGQCTLIGVWLSALLRPHSSMTLIAISIPHMTRNHSSL